MRVYALTLCLLVLVAACVGVRNSDFGSSLGTCKQTSDKNQLVVLMDEDLPIYGQVVTGIHVASKGHYHLMRLHEDGLVQSALLEQLLVLKPRALIALGPKAANAVASAHLILPSAFSMVPRIENYELDNVFVAGIRMIPDVKEQLGLVRSLLPDTKALGVLYSRQNSRSTLQKIRSLCDDDKFELVNMEVQSTGDVLPALRRHYHDLSAVLMLDDPLLLDAEVIAAMTQFLALNNIALIGLDCSMVREGALFSFGTNFYKLGRELVDVVSRDHNPRQYLPTVFSDPKEPDICINLSTLAKIADGDQLYTRAIKYAAKKGVVVKAFE